jgi:predicted phosphodiesterase
VAKKWNETMDNRRVELLKKGYSYDQVASVLTDEFEQPFSMRSVESRSWTTRTTRELIGVKELKRFIVSSEELDAFKNPSEEKLIQSKETIDLKRKSESKKESIKFNVKSKKSDSMFAEELYSINGDLLFAPEKKKRLKEIWDSFNDGKPKKILSLSDLHAPFINFNSVEKALKAHGDADILVLNGDVFDGNALSDFDKLNDFDIEVEFQQVFALLDVATKMFDQIYWVGGNHDLSRFFRMVARKFGNGMKKYVLNRLNPITYIAEKYDNITVIPHQWMQIGKAVFIHPDGYSSALMSSALGQEKVLRANAKEVLPSPDFEVLIMGHTHDAGEYMMNGCKVMEQGCLTYVPDYRHDRPSSRQWVQAYAVVNLFGDGSVDMNNTRIYLVD